MVKKEPVNLKAVIETDDYLKISSNKLHDAWVLFRNERFEGACYNAGYTVECLLKYIFLKEFKCSSRKDVEDLSRDSDTNANLKRIYKISKIDDFAQTIFEEDYNSRNISIFYDFVAEIYGCVLDEHAIQYGLEKLIQFGKTKLVLDNYKYILDWSEQWRYRQLTEEKSRKIKKGVKITIRSSQTDIYNINDSQICEYMIKEIASLVKQFSDERLISSKHYSLYKDVLKDILEKEVG